MPQNKEKISHYLVKLYTHHKYDETITPFLDEDLAASYASQFPIESSEGFDICYELYRESEADQLSTNKSVKKFCLDQLERESYRIELDYVVDSDWQNEWKKFFKPISIGKRLIIAPSWEETDYKGSRAIVRLDPGMAFGTGSHGTTKGCMHFIEKYIRPDMKVLDFGTGSGVLAIAALKLGATDIHAVDNDPLAIEVSIVNCEMNDCENQISFETGSVESIPDSDYNFVLANLTVAIHIQLLDDLLLKCKKASHIVLSGISDFSRPELDIFLKERKLNVSEIYEENDWFTYLLKING